MQTGRNSVGFEIDPVYFRHARQRIEEFNSDLFRTAQVTFHE
jgi:DNA modification methylase